MAGYWETGDDSLVPPMLSLAGFTRAEAAQIARHREALADAGIGGLVRGSRPARLRVLRKVFNRVRAARGETAQARRRGRGCADPGADPGADASPAPSTAPPTAERMGGADLPGASDDDGNGSDAERFNRADETRGEPLRDVGDGSGVGGAHAGEGVERRHRPDDPPVAARGERGAPIGTPIGTSDSAPRLGERQKKPNRPVDATMRRRRQRVTREAEKSARRERQRASTSVVVRLASASASVLGSATRHRGGVNVVGGHFAGFDDEEHRDKERRERAKAGAPLPAPKLKGRAAEAEARRRREEEARRATGDGFAGFGSDETNDSDSD